MPLDGFTIKALAHQLNEELAESRIDKIYQPEKDEISLAVRTLNSGNVRLVLSANPRWARMHITSEKRPNPANPPSFCMLLRKYLEGGKIKEIRQVEFERIVHITIEALDEFRDWKPRLLVCEFMGKHSNIILVNPETNLIIDAIKRYGSEVSTHREVYPGLEYIAPPDQGKLNPLHIDSHEFASRIWSLGSLPLSQAVFDLCSGISPFTARELCIMAGNDPSLPVDQCGEYEFSKLLQTIVGQAVRVNSSRCSSAVLLKGKKVMDYTPLDIDPDPASTGIRSYASINEAADFYYQTKLNELRFESKQTNLARTIKVWLDKAQKKQFFQEGDLAKAEEKEQLRTWGELITAYAHQLNKGQSLVELQDFYTGETVEIELEPRLTPIQNAQKYFKQYNKSRSAIRHLHALLEQTIQEVNYLDSVMVAVNQSDSMEQLDEIIEELEKGQYLRERSKKDRRSQPKSHPRRFISTDGLEILVGRNNRQNDQLTTKLADRQDLWLHTRQIPGSHVIIRLPRTIKTIDQVPEVTLEEAALLAAYYSKARQDEKVPVDYTFRGNVRKPSGAKPGMVIYENHWTIYTTPGADRLQAVLEKAVADENQTSTSE